MVQEGSTGISKLKVMYTNVNGLITGLVELNDYLRDNTPDIVGITETKLDHVIEAINIGDGKYDVYRRDRKGKKGGGVVLLVKKGFEVDKVILGEDSAEVLKVGIKDKGKALRDFAVVYVPPKTSSWGVDEYQKMLKDTEECMKSVIVRSRNITIMGDFNCKEVLWEDWLTEGGELSWGNRLLQLAMDNILTQWVTENTRF